MNALYLIPGAVGGTEIYLRNLLLAFSDVDVRHEFFVYINAETGADLAPALPRFHSVQTHVKARFRPGRILYEQIRLPRLLRRDSIDVLLNPGFTAPASWVDRSVTVFHDLQHKRHPEFFRWFDLPFWNFFLWMAASRSRRLVAVSEATASDLVRYYPGTRDKIVVVAHGVDEEFFRIGRRREHTAPDPFLLTVSTLHPHKNLHRLLRAFQLFRKSHPAFQLVVVGCDGFAARDLKTARRELGLEQSVRFTGWIPRGDLYRLFETACGYIAPSLFEGFGMPVTESLAAGLPTACSAIEALDAAAGDAAIRFHPQSIAEITEAMRTIVCDADFRSRARVAGPAQARMFDWRKTARLTIEMIEKTGVPGVSPPQ